MTGFIPRVIEQCALGKITGEIQSVPGGLLHGMFRVETSRGVFAVKHLNPQVMARPDAHKNYARAETLEARLEKAGLPVIAALSFGGKKMVEVDGNFFYVFRWQIGKITDWDCISESRCRIAGALLGRIHEIPVDVPADSAQENPGNPPCYDFGAYIKMEKIAPHIKTLLSDNLTLLSAAQEKLDAARAALPPLVCITDSDLDPKNVMWDNGNPHIIDLECLDYGNPAATALVLALQWAGTVTMDFRRENLAAFFHGYFSEHDDGFRAYDRIFGAAYNWLGWLDYNLSRASGTAGEDAAEQKTGALEAERTIRRIAYLSGIEDEVRQVLRNWFR
ncbi:MAG: aminoglycoside phosphotransferase family protein [Treponema sp.]|nr:aminoglycoside phosphotransferase family protein [Treponema sp.]